MLKKVNNNHLYILIGIVFILNTILFNTINISKAQWTGPSGTPGEDTVNILTSPLQGDLDLGEFNIIGNGSIDADSIDIGDLNLTSARVKGTASDLHLDAGTGHTYLNYYDGEGVYFGDGGQNIIGTWLKNGNLTTTGTICDGSGNCLDSATFDGNYSFTGNLTSNMFIASSSLGENENLFYGNANGSTTGNLLLLQSDSGDNKFKVDTIGNTTIGGNVGIGTEDPGALLDVKAYNDDYNIIRATDEDGQYRWRVDQYFNMYLTDSAGNDRIMLSSGNFNYSTDNKFNANFTIKADNLGNSARIARFYNNGLDDGENMYFHIGEEDSNNNTGELSWTKESHSSDSNFLSLGTHGSPNTLNIVANDRVGIGTTDPQVKLDINGNIRISNGNQLELITEDGQNLRGYMRASETSPHLDIATSNGEDIAFRDGGPDGDVNLLIQGTTGNVTIAGDVSASNFFYSSDQRLKKNIKTITNPLEKIIQLEGVSFNWKKDNKESIGLIAQDVEKIFPELVSTNEQGLKSIAYANLIAPLIEALKIQDIKIEELIKEIELLKNEQYY